MLQDRTLQNPGVHLLRKKEEAVAPAFLGSVHGSIGVRDKGFGVDAMFGIDADSQAAADLEGAALNDEVGVNSAHDAFGHDGGFGFVTDGAQHDIACSSEKESTGH